MTTPNEKSNNNIAALVMLTILMFLWGLANNMTGTMLQNFRHIINMSDIQESIIKSAFHAAYLFAALPAVIYLYKKHSYRATILLGLMLFAMGAMFFFPNFYNDIFKKYTFYKSYESGLKEIAEVEFDKEINEPINRDKNGLYLYPVHVTYLDGLSKTNKVIYTLEKDLNFKKGDKLTITTYQRVIIKAESHL